MLAVSWDTVRLFLHVLAATIWVGGQLILAALVPVLRRFGAEVPRAAARRFNQVAWTAYMAPGDAAPAACALSPSYSAQAAGRYRGRPGAGRGPACRPGIAPS